MKWLQKAALIGTLLGPAAAGARPQSPPPPGGEQPPGPVRLRLQLPAGTPLSLTLDRPVRIARPGELVSARLAHPLFAFDQVVLPAGTPVSGRVGRIRPVSKGRRMLSFLNGNFSPPHGFDLEFDNLTLPGGKSLPLSTVVSAGTPSLVHLAPGRPDGKRKNAASRMAENARHRAAERVQTAVEQIHSPGRFRRFKSFLLAQLPYRRQYLERGSAFTASLLSPLDFGETTRTREQLADFGSSPAPETLLQARLVSEVSSATARRGTAVAAVLTEPLFSTGHLLVLPVGSRLGGEVTTARPARSFHRHGLLRLVFKSLEPPEGIARAIQGNLSGAEVDRGAGLKLDEEGGARATESQKRYLSTALVLGLSGWAVHPEYENGAVSIADSGGKQAGAGLSGSKLTGVAVSLVSRSAPVSIIFAVYGASSSVYTNFLSRGREVVFPEQTRIEVSLGSARTPPSGAKSR